jgi:hypothetical protein
MERLSEILRLYKVNPASLSVLFEATGTKIYTLRVPGARAANTWKRLRQLVSFTGHWPVLLGGEQGLRLVKEQLRKGADSFEATTAKLLEEAAQLPLDPGAWARQRRATMLEWMKKNNGPAAVIATLEATLVTPREVRQQPPEEPWADGVRPNNDFVIPYDPYDPRKLLAEVTVGLVPTQTSWHVPVLLRFGGFNACPFPAEHAALLRYWEGRYGAEVVGMTHDTIELSVARPPKERPEALELAGLHLSYCGDLDQALHGTRGPLRPTLAARLLGAKVWYFWWD